MAAVERTADGVVVRLEDGREVTGSHALLAVGSVPQTRGIGLEEIGVELTASGHVAVDRVSRTSVRGVYAAGDVTGVLPLASVAAMQGRIAMSHALGDAVAPLNLRVVSANIFTDPEIATVGVSQKDVDEEVVDAEVLMLPLSRNARAKMLGITDGFVKLFAQKGSGAVVGGVVVAPRASELIFPVTLAVQHRLNVDQVASTFTVYPRCRGRSPRRPAASTRPTERVARRSTRSARRVSRAIGAAREAGWVLTLFATGGERHEDDPDGGVHRRRVGGRVQGQGVRPREPRQGLRDDRQGRDVRGGQGGTEVRRQGRQGQPCPAHEPRPAPGRRAAGGRQGRPARGPRPAPRDRPTARRAASSSTDGSAPDEPPKAFDPSI